MNREQRCGFEALRQALEADEPVRVVLHRRGELTPSELDVLDRARAHGADVQAIGARELTRAAAVPGADVLVMIGPDPHAALDALLSRAGAIWLLVGTAYPGNAGFVIRSAEVSGAAGVVIDADFNRTARRDAGRAAMRADRMLPVLYADAAQVVERAMAAGHRIVAVEDSGECLPWDVDLTGAVLFLIGGEQHGVPQALLAEAHEVVRIPMQGFMRSYNLQAAMAAVMAERLRQQGAPATNRSD